MNTDDNELPLSTNDTQPIPARLFHNHQFRELMAGERQPFTGATPAQDKKLHKDFAKYKKSKGW